MEVLAYTHSYAAYEQAEGIEYDLPKLKLGWEQLPSSAWLSFVGVAVMSSSLGLAIPASAALYVKTNGNCLHARTGPGTQYATVKCVSNGAKLLPTTSEGYDAAGNKWYKLSSGRWVMAKYTSGTPGDTNNNTGGDTGGNTGGTNLILKVGSTGDRVKALQQHLQKNFYNVGVIDGFYGKQTEAAVRAYQENNGLSGDGMAGRLTLQRMGLL